MEKFWKVEWIKYSTHKVKTFNDSGAANRCFSKYGQAKMTEYERQPDGTVRILSCAIAGDKFNL